MMNSMINTFDREAIHEEVQNEKELDFRYHTTFRILIFIPFK